jgi:hypothetical protein
MMRYPSLLLATAEAFAIILWFQPASGFSMPSNNMRLQNTVQKSVHQKRSFIAVLHARRPRDDDSEDDEEEEDDDDEGGMFEFARVRRRGRRGRDYDDDRQVDEDLGRAADSLEARGIFDRYQDDEEDDDDEELGGFFANVIQPNPILDSIDPDGAAERFPELARDPKFWFDMVLFLAFINFVSFIGPRNPYPDFIDVMRNAQLPPPGI